jgi:non-canonical (house-cleaning) NTP pyrophosphatase
MIAARLLPFVLLLAACDDKPAPAASASSAPSALASVASAALSAPPPAVSVTTPPTRIAAQHVLVAFRGATNCPSGVTRTKAAAQARAAEVVAKAKAGEDFSSLVAQYSDDPGAKGRMGSLGMFTRDKMDKTFSDAAFQLNVDQVSDVVETRFGFHVIKRNQ